MRHTYEGILKDDRIEWIGDTPSPSRTLRVRVTIVDDATVDDEEQTGRGGRMADALKRLARTNPFGEVEDPVAWQRQIREDRSLPDREEDAA
jgi:hypothetical protein